MSTMLSDSTIICSAIGTPLLMSVPTIDQSAVAKRGFFYVGGHYVGEPGKEIMQGQIYVEVLAPKEQRRPYPLVLIHGAAQTATNWMGTPDGREGWADYFLDGSRQQKRVVCLPPEHDQATRDRSVTGKQ